MHLHSSKILIRADATSQMGTGHVMRCLALAMTAIQEGMPPTLTGYFGVPWVQQRLSEEKVPCCPLALTDVDGPKALENFLNKIDELKPDCVVLDGYHFALNWQEEISKAVDKLLFIDDYGHLSQYKCDFLLNQNVGAEAIRYQGDVGELLVGPHYALLRPEFSKARAKAESRTFTGYAKRLLLNLGGGNFSEFLPFVSSLLRGVLEEKVMIRVLAGAMPKEAIAKAFQDMPVTLEILHNVREIPELLLDTDLCISAGGSTCWELCCMGVPFLTLIIAKNQEFTVIKMEHDGIAPKLTAETLEEFITDPQAREKSSHSGMKLIDGHGTSRVLRCITSMHNA